MRKIDLTDFQVATSETARQINRRIALNFIRRHQPMSRADLARRSGLQRSTVSAIIDQLSDTPVLLTQRGQGAGVLVHPETWNKLIGQLEHLLHLELLRTSAAEMERGEYVTFEEFEQDLAKRAYFDE